MEMVFNEISVAKKNLTTLEANTLFSSFLKTYSKAVATDLGISRSIITPIDFNALEISSGYYVAAWRNSPTVDKDDKRRLLGICERQNVSVPSTEDYQFVQYDDSVGKGLQMAYENQSSLISIPSSENWKQNVIQALLCDVENETESQIPLKNIYSKESLDEHKDWLKFEKNKENSKIRTPDAFLSNIPTLFPSLVFHRNALTQIKSQVNPVNIPTILDKLLVLEKYFSDWDGGKFERSAFPPRFVSPESEETLSRFETEHTFEWDGSSVLVSYHVRYTGGDIPGRIYIFPLHDQKKCLVCSLHTKLPTVSDPKF